MKNLESAFPSLLNHLYERATEPGQWPEFLGQLAAVFHTDTATLRLTDLRDPVIYHSYTVGFHQRINQHYESAATAFERDPFRQTLAESPVGKVLNSPDIIDDRKFEHSEHYQQVFRPNGNFYAMGTQFERDAGRALHIGIHRPKRKGPFTRDELTGLELFSPHLQRVTRLSHLMASLNEATMAAQQALDQLPFGVWYMDGELRIHWMNSTAEEALSTNTYGLSLQGATLRMHSGEAPKALTDRLRKLVQNQSLTETLPLGRTGACLVMMQSQQSANGFHIGRALTPRILCFLLDSGRLAQLNPQLLATVYQMTPAEIRLANLLVSDLDVNEASALLQISPHTGRTHLKSIMQKTGVSRQANLQRKLLLCADVLRQPHE